MRSIHEKAVENSGAIVVVVDPDGKAEYVSPSVNEVLGYSPEKLLGDGWFAFTDVNGDDRERVLTALSGVTSGSSAVTPYERQLRTAWGGSKWILWKTSRDEQGNLVGIGYDISERKSQQLQLEERTKVLEERTLEMESSLRYAKRIQEAILPSEKVLEEFFSSSFVYYKPKDIVSGDWWWVHRQHEEVYVAVIDCTGHGVPGALLSVLAHSVFREIFLDDELRSTTALLHAIDDKLRGSFQQEESGENKLDGMDVALVWYSPKERKVEFAGAGRPVIVKRGDDLIQLKGDIHSIGGIAGSDKTYHSHKLDLESGDVIYLFSDGFADQFGGEHDKRLGSKGFRELLHSMRDMNAEEQGSFLAYALQNWKQDTEQTDDITIIGLQV